MVHCRFIGAAICADAVLIEKIQRRAVFLCERHRIDAAERQMVHFIDTEIGMKHNCLLVCRYSIVLRSSSAESGESMAGAMSNTVLQP